MLQCLAVKGEAEACYKSRDYESAIIKYRTALKCLEDDPRAEEDPTVKQVLIVLHSNLAICHSYTEDYDLVLQHAEKVLHLEPNHPKASYRKAYALYQTGRLVEATQQLRTLLESHGPDPATKQLWNKVKAAVENCGLVDTDQFSAALELIARVLKTETPTAVDLEGITTALQFLRQWLLKNARPEALTRVLLGRQLCALLHKVLLSNASEFNPEHLEVAVSAFQLLNLYILDKDMDSNTVTVQCQKRRTEVAENLNLGEFTPFCKEIIEKQGVSDISKTKDEVKFNRTEIIKQLLQLVGNISSLEDESHMEYLALCLECVECPSIRQMAVVACAKQCAKRRDMGKKVPPLTLSAGLRAILVALTDAIESCHRFEEENDSDLQIDFALTGIFHLLSDPDRDSEATVDWQMLLDRLISGRVSNLSNSEDLYTCFALLNVLWLSNKDSVQTASLLLSLPIIALGQCLNGIQGSRVERASCQYLLNAMEFPEIRSIILEADGMEILTSFAQERASDTELKSLCAALISRLGIHNDETLWIILTQFDVLGTIKDLLQYIVSRVDENGKDIVESIKSNKGYSAKKWSRTATNVLNVILHLSFHGKFKQMVFGISPSTLR